MNSQLFGRALGTISPQAVQRATTTQLLRAIDAAPQVQFDGTETVSASATTAHDGFASSRGGASREGLAHKAGVNCVVVDRLEGR
jgi:hypothetical protein